MAKPRDRRLGTFRLVQSIGTGMMGEVFLAEHVERKETCAVKVLPAELTSDPEFLTRLENEAWKIHKLDHPSIVRVRHFGQSEGVLFFAMDYVPGLRGPAPTLAARLERRGRRALKERKVRALALQILGALDHAHRSGVLHLSLKPSSVLLDANGRARLTDFGVAAVVGNAAYVERAEQAGRPPGSPLPTWDATGPAKVPASPAGPPAADASPPAPAPLEEAPTEDAPPEREPGGTEAGIGESGPRRVPYLPDAADCLAPEQVRGLDLDARTDVYAFGVMLFRMLTGVRPAEVSSDAELIARGVNPHWIRVARQCMEGFPAERYPSAAAVKQAILAIRRDRPPRINRRLVLRASALVPIVLFVGWLGAKALKPVGDQIAALEWQVNSTVRLPGGVTMPFVRVEAGRFRMGEAEADADPDAGPASVEVALTRPFFLGVTEVTQAQWQAVMKANPSQFTDAPDLPVERVSWDDCQEFLARLNRLGLGTFRLPTEAEWEYACRAGSRTRYIWGDSDDRAALDAHAWNGENAGHRTHPVQQKEPNAWGLHDMYGNVGEWCHDRFGPYPDLPVTDPRGPLIGAGRVIRGGSYFPAKSDCRSAARDHAEPHVRIAFIGLRLVREDG